MPTVRSEFTIDQFEAVLQQIACNIVSEETGVECKIKREKFHRVTTETWELDFRYSDDGHCRRISVRHMKHTGKFTCYRCDDKVFTEAEAKKHVKEKHDGIDWYIHEQVDAWGFGVEPKIYYSSPHSTKIDVGDDKERPLKWIEEIMANAGVKPTPRFSLAKHTA